LDESWSASLFTGDQCALCENPLEDDSTELLEDGELLQVCGACASKRARTPLDEADAGSVFAEADRRSKTVQELVSCRADEQTQLEEIAQFIQNLASAVGHWQERVARLEQQNRTVEAENRRLRERLRRAAALLASRAADPAALADQSFEEAAAFGVAAVHAPAGAAAGTSEKAELTPSDEEPTAEEVRLTSRFFNESPHTEKTRSVRRSLGRPIVNLTKLASPKRQMLLTIAWEIVWYQYLVALDDAGSDEERVSLFAEGMELQEVGPVCARPNANMDDEGRIDASELEFSLISDRSQLIDDLSPEQAVLEDATEEIWDRHTSPEFRWDD
jgi:TolA-binding protein